MSLNLDPSCASNLLLAETSLIFRLGFKGDVRSLAGVVLKGLGVSADFKGWLMASRERLTSDVHLSFLTP